LFARPREALDRAANAGRALTDTREANLAVGHDRLLRQDALAPLGGTRLRLAERFGRARAFGDSVLEPASRLGLLGASALERVHELFALALHDGLAPAHVRELILGAAQILLRRDERELSLMRLVPRAIERRAHLGHAAPQGLLRLEESGHFIALLR